MNTSSRYRELLDRCLDARRDPLDDPDLAALLDEHPELLDGFARERADLRALAASAGPRRRRRRLLRAAVAVAAGVTAGVALRLGPLAPEPPVEPEARPPRIVSASLVEDPPTAHPSVHYTVHEPLVRTATTVLETYERRSELR